MTEETPNSIPTPPQVDRAVTPVIAEEPRGLWSQLLTVFRDLGGTFDPFANDANPDVRALGRAARSRPTAQPDDYLALGDLCARLTASRASLSQTYAAKTIAAYSRAAEVDPGLEPVTRAAILAFTGWIAESARAIGTQRAIEAALLVCERVRAMGIGTSEHGDGAWLRQTVADLMERLPADTPDDVQPVTSASRRRTNPIDEAQMLLRQSKADEALQILDSMVQTSHAEPAAWLWRAMALTDLGRFSEALNSYDRALDIDPNNAAMWNNKGALLMELERYDSALACFERAVSLVGEAAIPSQAVYWLNKGKVLYLLNRHDEAMEALTRSYTLEPSAESAAGITACRERLAP